MEAVYGFHLIVDLDVIKHFGEVIRMGGLIFL